MGNIVVPQMFGQQSNLGHWSVDGLVFYWRGIPAGNAVDESLYGNHGTITGATWVGNALSFDGVNGNVELSQIIGGYNAITIILRVRPQENQDGGWFCIGTRTLNADWFTGLRMDIPTEVRAVLGNGSDSSLMRNSPVSSIIENTWYTIAAVMIDDGVTFPDIYIDGTLANGTTSSVGASPSMNTGIVYIGAGVKGSALCDISDMKIYNRALSASEIATLYINPNLPMQQPPIWLFMPPPVVGAVPKGPLGHPLFGPFAGPIAC